MPAKTTEKGEIGEAMVIADLIRQGHDVAIPFGHNQPFDLIVIRREDGRLEKVQVKYSKGNGAVVRCVIRSSSAWVSHRYTPDEVDWVAMTRRSHGASTSLLGFGTASRSWRCVSNRPRTVRSKASGGLATTWHFPATHM